MYRLIRPWLFAVTVLSVTLTVATAWIQGNEGFLGKGSIYVYPSPLIEALGFKRGSYITPAQENTDRLTNMLRDNLPGGFLDRVVQRAGIDRGSITKLQKGLNVQPDNQQTFTITLAWDNPDECQRLLKALQRQYIEQVGDEEVSNLANTVAFLKKNLHEMSATKRAANRFTGYYGPSVKAAVAEIVQRASELKLQLDHLSATSGTSSQRITLLKKRLGSIHPPPSDCSCQSPCEVAPEYQQIQTSIIEAEIEEQERQGEAANLKKQLGTYEQMVQTLPGAVNALNNLERAYIFQQKPYSKLVERLDTPEIQVDVEKATAITRLAPLGNVEVSPMVDSKVRLLKALVSLALGLAVGASLFRRSHMHLPLRS